MIPAVVQFTTDRWGFQELWERWRWRVRSSSGINRHSTTEAKWNYAIDQLRMWAKFLLLKSHLGPNPMPSEPISILILCSMGTESHPMSRLIHHIDQDSSFILLFFLPSPVLWLESLGEGSRSNPEIMVRPDFRASCLKWVVKNCNIWPQILIITRPSYSHVASWTVIWSFSVTS